MTFPDFLPPLCNQSSEAVDHVMICFDPRWKTEIAPRHSLSAEIALSSGRLARLRIAGNSAEARCFGAFLLFFSGFVWTCPWGFPSPVVLFLAFDEATCPSWCAMPSWPVACLTWQISSREASATEMQWPRCLRSGDMLDAMGDPNRAMGHTD